MNRDKSRSKKRTFPRIVLPLIFVATLMVAGLSVYALREARKGPFWGMRIGDSLRVQLIGRVGNTNRIPIAQVQARAMLLKQTQTHSMFILDDGLENDERVRITNLGSHTIQCNAFNPSSPHYRIEVDRGG